MTEGTVTCEYRATADEAGVRGVDGEVVEGDVVYCTADAELVLRPPGSRGLAAAQHGGPVKRVFCRAHGRYLQREKTEEERDQMQHPPKKWEQIGGDPEVIVDARRERR